MYFDTFDRKVLYEFYTWSVYERPNKRFQDFIRDIRYVFLNLTKSEIRNERRKGIERCRTFNRVTFREKKKSFDREIDGTKTRINIRCEKTN